MKKKKIDWEKVEAEYRAGALSIKEVARRNGCTDTAIHKKAKIKGWKRDLLKKVTQEAKNKLVCAEVCASNLSEKDIIDAASSEIAEVVRMHRKDINSGQEVVRNLLYQLSTTASAAEVQDVDKDNPFKDAKILQTYASIAVNLSNAMKNFVGLSRQAFSMDDGAGSDKESSLSSILAELDIGGLPKK